ncbi:MAG: hypothetical protein NDJ89_05230 [Oligoflexia bacterium]|nr:hypothetical protein [Oligoflexia bacterium]
MFRPLFPPRPEGSLPPESLSGLRGHIVQPKYDDIRAVIYFLPDSGITLLSRQREPIASFRMTDRMRASFERLKLPRGEFHVLDGGLLRRWRDRVVLWDVLVYRGNHLLGTTYRQRYELLKKIAGNPVKWEGDTGHRIALRIAETLWLAPDLGGSGLHETFARFREIEGIEGFVLKDPNGRLERGIRERNNGTWQIRVRKPSANYFF